MEGDTQRFCHLGACMVQGQHQFDQAKVQQNMSGRLALRIVMSCKPISLFLLLPVSDNLPASAGVA